MALAAQLPEVPRTQAPRYPEQNQSITAEQHNRPLGQFLIPRLMTVLQYVTRHPKTKKKKKP